MVDLESLIDDGESFLNFGIAEGSMEYIKKSILKFNQIIKIDDKNLAAYILRAKANSRLHNYNLAINDCEKVISINIGPESKYIYNSLANLNFITKKYDSALKNINSAIELDKNNYSLYHMRGKINKKLNNNFDAIDDYKNSIKLNLNDLKKYEESFKNLCKLEKKRDKNINKINKIYSESNGSFARANLN